MEAFLQVSPFFFFLCAEQQKWYTRSEAGQLGSLGAGSFAMGQVAQEKPLANC